MVALHRAVRLLRADPQARVLLTTFSQPLADALRRKVDVLAGPDRSLMPRLTVAPFDAIALELYEAALGHRPRLATEAQPRAALAKAGEGETFSERFLLAEWAHVFDAWQVEDAAAYAGLPRLGRKNRLGAKQRERRAAVFLAARESLRRQHLMTPAEVFGAVARHHESRAEKPFTHVVVDEAQDLGVPELRFLAAIVAPGPNALFFAGDLGQRIFQQPFSWKGLGIDLRGRSAALKVNYRTSHQIRQVADRLLPPVVRDVDNREEERKGTISAFDGPVPEVAVCDGSEADDVERQTLFWPARTSDRAAARRNPSRLEVPRSTASARGDWRGEAMRPHQPKPQRCAIYTCKSTEHNLDIAFNLLDAQREAFEAYIKSQARGLALGAWRYHDGGLSGASLTSERSSSKSPFENGVAAVFVA